MTEELTNYLHIVKQSYKDAIRRCALQVQKGTNNIEEARDFWVNHLKANITDDVLEAWGVSSKFVGRDKRAVLSPEKEEEKNPLLDPDLVLPPRKKKGKKKK